MQVYITFIPAVRQCIMAEQAFRDDAGKRRCLPNFFGSFFRTGEADAGHARIQGKVDGDFFIHCFTAGRDCSGLFQRRHSQRNIMLSRTAVICRQNRAKDQYGGSDACLPQLHCLIHGCHSQVIRLVLQKLRHRHSAVTVGIGLYGHQQLHAVRKRVSGRVKIVFKGIQVYFRPGAQGMVKHGDHSLISVYSKYSAIRASCSFFSISGCLPPTGFPSTSQTG